jgi:hypothetical protein
MPPLLACMLVVAELYGLPPRVLPAIHAVEGGWAGAVRGNANGSEDYGPMQVNSVWLGPLSRSTGLPPEILRERLIGDECFNVAVAGAILRLHLDASGNDLMRAIGNYHSRTPARHQAYQERVLSKAARLYGAPAEAR